MPAQNIGKLLASLDDLKALSDKSRHLTELQQVLFDSAPRALAQASRVKSYRAGTLYLLADNTAIAAKLRQLAPRLLVELRKCEPEVTGIHVAVQVTRPRDAPRPRSERKILGADSIGQFRKLSEKLADSPLKTALANLVRRHSRSN